MQRQLTYFLTRALVLLWTFPTTLVGLIFLPPALFTRSAQIVDGVLEIHGGLARWFLARCVPLPGGASAMTFGHVVIARDQRTLDATRSHERVHVRQCERWGPLFIPAYLLASAISLARGRDPYLDNAFEREAYDNDSRRAR